MYIFIWYAFCIADIDDFLSNTYAKLMTTDFFWKILYALYSDKAEVVYFNPVTFQKRYKPDISKCKKCKAALPHKDNVRSQA
jgi:hypothetical protein